MWLVTKENLLKNTTLINLGIEHFVTTKKSGNMVDKQCRDKILIEQNFIPEKLVYAEQVHSNKIKFVNSNDSGKTIPHVDGLITNSYGVALGIFTADCAPVFIVGKSKVGLIHAGWRGISLGIIEKAIDLFNEEVSVVIGPHICKNCYKVNSNFSKLFPYGYRNGFLNLQKEIFFRLKRKKIPATSIKCIRQEKYCTYHNSELFYSHRRKNFSERMLSVIICNKNG